MIGDQHYSRSHAEEWSKTITESITEGMKKFNLENTKFIINTTILEKTDKCCQVSRVSKLYKPGLEFLGSYYSNWLIAVQSHDSHLTYSYCDWSIQTIRTFTIFNLDGLAMSLGCGKRPANQSALGKQVRSRLRRSLCRQVRLLDTYSSTSSRPIIFIFSLSRKKCFFSPLLV